jgi:hypothetical protein
MRNDGLPWWWLWSREEQRDNEASDPTMLVAYFWSMLIFVLLVWLGHVTYSRRQNLDGIIMAFIMYANGAFLSMLYLGGLEGGVRAEGPDIEDTGFYGQLGTLIFMSDMAWTAFTIVYAFVFYRIKREFNLANSNTEGKDYHTAPEVSVSTRYGA